MSRQILTRVAFKGMLQLFQQQGYNTKKTKLNKQGEPEDIIVISVGEKDYAISYRDISLMSLKQIQAYSQDKISSIESLLEEERKQVEDTLPSP